MTTYIIITCAIALTLNAVNFVRLIRPTYAQLAVFVGGQVAGVTLTYLLFVTWLGWTTFVAFNVTFAVAVGLTLFIMLSKDAKAAK